MCVVLILKNVHPDFPLVILHGRDEFFARSTIEADLHGDIICGIDLVAKGTWCGFNRKTGRGVFLTNFRTRDLAVAPRSRGTLVMHMLEGKAVEGEPEEYGPYNVVSCNFFEGSLGSISVKSNVECGANVDSLSDGCHVLSNSHVDDATWPKVEWMRKEAQKIMEQLKEEREENNKNNKNNKNNNNQNQLDEMGEGLRIVTTLANQIMCDASEHEYDKQDDVPQDELEKKLRQTVFIGMENYGTLSHTAVIASKTHVYYMFRTFKDGKPHEWKTWAIPIAGKL